MVTMTGGVRYAVIESMTDSRDNVTYYIYDQQDRLSCVQHPTGIHECWNYDPTWIGQGAGKWDDTNYSGVEVTFFDVDTGSTVSGRTRYYLFHRLRNPQGNLVPNARPFGGDLLYRTYQASFFVLDPVAAGSVAQLPTGLSQSVERYAVTELTYHSGTRRVHEFRSLVVDGVAHGLPVSQQQTLVAYQYEDWPAGSGYRRVKTEYFPQEGLRLQYSYVFGDSSSPNRVTQFTRLEQAASSELGPSVEDFVQRVEVLDSFGRPTEVTTTPLSSNSFPRTSDPDNGGWVEPTSRKFIYQYGACNLCAAKPTLVRDDDANRVYEFDYDSLTGLLTEERFPSPTGTGVATRKYVYEVRTPGQIYSAYDIDYEEDEFGRTFNYSYGRITRAVASHGAKNQWVDRSSPGITLADGTTGPPVQETIYYDTSVPQFYTQGGQKAYVGHVSSVNDGDGVTTNYEVDADGRPWRVIVNPSGGADEIESREVRDHLGRVTTYISNYGSALQQETHVEYNSADMVTRVWRTVGAQTMDERFFYDSLGHLTVHLERNVTSTDSAPVDFGSPGRSETAREWLRSEYQYEGVRLATLLVDRRPLDRDDSGSVADAAGARFLRTDFGYHPRGWVTHVYRPNGAVEESTFDGYGALYKRSLQSTGQDPVVERWFVNDALEVVRHVKGDGAVELATDLERNSTGVVEKVTEPRVAPPGTWYPVTTNYVAFGIREFDTDVGGNVVESRIYDGSTATPTLLARTVNTYDELGRVYRVDRFDPPGASAAARSMSVLWGGASQSDKVTLDFNPANPGTQTRTVESVFDAAGRLTERFDSLPATPNRVIRTFEAKTWLTKTVTRKLRDEHPGTAGYVDRVVQYSRDGLGRVVQILQEPNATSPLSHTFTYYSNGRTESYTDPAGKVQNYLPDALGRLVEHYLPGVDPIWNESKFQVWTGTDDRSETVRTDGRGRVTRSIVDFAGRVQAIMNPGATVEPTSASPHQAFAKFFAYNSASQLTGVSQGNGVHTAHYRDGMGRLIARSTPTAGANQFVSLYHGRDILVRNGLGQVTYAANYYGPDGSWGLYQQEIFGPDSLGRNHLESFRFLFGNNWVEVDSGFTNGDSVRTALTYDNNAGGDGLWLDYLPDAIGRLSRVDWRTSSGGTPETLADYLHEGGRIRRRTTHWGPGASDEFDTDYRYDVFGRMDQITQSFSASATVGFFYDDASSLLKEEYQKQGGVNEKGDRFTYDEHHRLESAWLGANQAELDNPGTGTFIKKLTYNLDAANNRESVTTQIGPMGVPSTANYDTQDAAPQGPSNRYEDAEGVAPLYDERGNTIFDGNFCYVYDDLNRISEVYILTGQDASSMSSVQSFGASGQSGSLSSLREAELARGKFAVTDPGVLRAARRRILGRVPEHPGRIHQLHWDPSFRRRLSEPLPPMAATRTAQPASGSATSSSAGSSGGEAENATMTLYAVYQYDAMNRRVNRSVIGVQTWFYAWDGWQEAEELTWDGTNVVPQRQFVWGEQLDELVAYRYRQPGQSAFAEFFVAEGGAHCPSRVLDDQGQVVEVQEYDSYGKASFFDGSGGYVGGGTQFAVGSVFRWKGHRADPETGLVLIRNRYYAPESGRFYSMDPGGVWFDKAARGNAYNYGAASPLVDWDPLGLQVIPTPQVIIHMFDNPLIAGIGDVAHEIAFGVQDGIQYGGELSLSVTVGQITGNWDPFNELVDEAYDGVLSLPENIGNEVAGIWDGLASGDPRSMAAAVTKIVTAGGAAAGLGRKILRRSNKPLVGPNGGTSWETARRVYWKRYGVCGEAPRRIVLVEYHKRPGKKFYIEETKELHHIKAQKDGGKHTPRNLKEVWPKEHERIDPYRFTGYNVVRVIGPGR